MRMALMVVSLIGVLLYGSLLAVTFLSPAWIEDYGASFIEQEVHEQVDAGIEVALSAASDRLAGAKGMLAGAARALQRNQAERIADLRQSLQDGLHQRIADTIAQARQLDCECRQRWADWIADGFQLQIADLTLSSAKLGDFLHRQYAEVVSQLKRDLRIFAGSNALIFALLGVVAMLRGRATVPLLLPAVLLAIAGLICSWFYLFEQNWLLTIVYNDWLGWGYLAYLALVFALLLDVLVNRARVVRGIIEGAGHVLGASVQIAPC